uniref:Tetratricopeptide repeat domain 12 n=1 Tax=Amphiprion percula TaxID=161767 RepID=A0A3P8SYF3_AMPPE
SFLSNVDKINFMEIMERDAEDRRVRRAAKVKKATLKDKGNEAYAKEDYETAVKYYSDGLAELRDMQPLYTNRAQAYIKLGKYKEAISDCEWALKCNERCMKAYLHMGKAYLGLKKYNEEYLTQVDLEEERDSQEMNAKQEFDKAERTATIVPQLLEKLSRPGQMPLFYCGGLELLSQAITDTGQTLFRLNNGFSIISSNDTVRSCLLQETNDPDSDELCASVLKLWRENQKLLMACPVSRQSIVQLLTSEHASVRNECLTLLYLYSQMPHSRCLAIDNLNVRRCSASEYKDILYPLLGLIINLSAITSPVIQELAVSLCDCCLSLLKDSDGGIITLQRAAGVLSAVLPQSSEAIEHVIQREVVRTLRWLLKGTGQTATKYAIKILIVCTAASHLAREELLKSDKLSILRHLLSSSCDEMVSGNAALCLAHCLELEGVASRLLGTDIVLLLLRHAAGDSKRTAVQRNAAIALGKLCRSEPHMSKLRELHGLEILHSCVKLIS